MHGIEVALPQGAMAISALIGDFREEFILGAHLYFVGGMAVPAGGQFFLSRGYGGAVDALDKFIINPPMAGAASSRKILEINGRPLILMGQNQVAIVAIGAYRAGKQSFLLQTYPVDAGRVIYDYIPFINSRNPGGFPTFAVAFAAKAGNIRPERRRIFILGGQYKMLSMAVRAVGDIRFLMKVILAMIAVRILLGHSRMAGGTVNPPGRLAGAREAGVHIRMTFNAGNIFMGRFL